MKKAERDSFARALMENAIKGICRGLENAPETWDGVEIRQYCMDYVKNNVVFCKMPKSRKAAYNNTILINNLL